MNLVSLSDFLETEAGHGRTLDDIATHFEVTVRTAQRWVKALSLSVNSPLREEWLGRKRAYRVVHHTAFERRGFPRAQTLSVAELRLNAKVLEVLGCHVQAKRLAAHVEDLMTGLARAHRTNIEQAVERLLNCLDIKHVIGIDPIPWNKTVETLHLAILSERAIAVSASGQSLRGRVARIHYAGRADSKVRLDDGSMLPLHEIEAVEGLHDLRVRML